jgi:hypothetical protein|tara:strand:- start:871 stop:1107 length:237 start_codon:yes stop_codon:yes gene_type:complete
MDEVKCYGITVHEMMRRADCCLDDMGILTTRILDDALDQLAEVAAQGQLSDATLNKLDLARIYINQAKFIKQEFLVCK